MPGSSRKGSFQSAKFMIDNSVSLTDSIVFLTHAVMWVQMLLGRVEPMMIATL
jgi:hypothetical protein